MNLKRATSVAFFLSSILLLCHMNIGLASDAVYKCGDTFTNDAVQAKRGKCPLLEAGPVVTIQTEQKAAAVKKNTQSSLSQSSTLKSKQAVPERSAEQKVRDDDAKTIIQSELNKTEARLADLQRQYAGLTTQDADKRLAIKQQMARAEADAVSLRRELAR